tara:strand:- start:5178 stop:5474 length:297 start_codon:yes stop_codon:yes gene_type:complete
MENAKISPLAFGLTLGCTWGAAVLIVGGVHAVYPSYGGAFLDLVGSIYPGVDHGGSGTTGHFTNALLATVYALLDGFGGGLVVAWLYNFFSRVTSRNQ